MPRAVLVTAAVVLVAAAGGLYLALRPIGGPGDAPAPEPAPVAVVAPAARPDPAPARRPMTIELVGQASTPANVPGAAPRPAAPPRMLTVGARVTAVAFHPTQPTELAVSTTTGEAVAWNLATGGRGRVLSKHAGQATAVAYSPKGETVLTAAGDRVKADLTPEEILKDVGEDDALEHVETERGVMIRNPGPSVGLSDMLRGDGRGDFSAILSEHATGKQLRRVVGHDAGVLAAAYAADGKRFATAAGDGKVVLWNAHTGRPVRDLVGHRGPVLATTFTPDGRRLLTGGIDRTAVLWDVAEGKPAVTLGGHANRVAGVAVSPDGLLAATGSVEQPTAETPAGRKESRYGKQHGTATLWDLTTGERVRGFVGHDHLVAALAFGPDGRVLVTGSWDGTAAAWEVHTGRRLAVFRGDGSPVDCVAVAADGSRLAFGTRGGKVFAHALPDRPAPDADAGMGDVVQAVAFSPDGTHLVTGSGDRFAANLWSLADGRLAHVFRGHTAAVPVVAFAPDGKTVLTGSLDHTAVLWDVRTGQPVRRLTGKTTHLPENPRLKTRAKTSYAGPLAGVTTGAFSPDGKRVYTGSQFYEELYGWDVATGAFSRVPPAGGLADTLGAVGVTPEGKTLFTAYAEGQVLLRTPAGATVAVLDPGDPGGRPWVNVAALSADGRWAVAAGLGGKVKVWDVVRRQARPDFAGHTKLVTAVAFSPDGRRLVTAAEDNAVAVWDVAGGKKTAALAGHTKPVHAAAVHPNGRLVVTAALDGTVRLWDADAGRELARLVADGGGLDWAVVAANDLFDGSAGGRRRLLGGPSGTVPLDRFRDLYRPGLLAELARGDLPGAAPAPAQAAPTVAVALAADPPAGLVALDVTVTDRSGGAREPTLLHNRVAAGTPANVLREGGVLRCRFELAPAPGLNHFEVRAATADGAVEGEPAGLTVQAAGPAARPRLHAVVVGINQYPRGGELRSLEFCAPDARAMAELLRLRPAAAYDPGEVRELTDAKATRSGIVGALYEVAKIARPQDVFVFFAAGHGATLGQRYYLLPHDYTASADRDADIRRDGLSVDDLAEAAARVPALNRVLIFDTCQSGSAVGLGGGPASAFAFRGAVERSARSQGVLTLAAASAAGAANGAKELEHGVLTYTLLKSLDPQKNDYLGDARVARSGPVDAAAWLRFARDHAPGVWAAFPKPGELAPTPQQVVLGGTGTGFPLLTAGAVDADSARRLREAAARQEAAAGEVFERRLAELEQARAVKDQAREDALAAGRTGVRETLAAKAAAFAAAHPEAARRYAAAPPGTRAHRFAAPAGKAVEAVAFRPDGLLLAATADQAGAAVALWDADRGAALATWADVLPYRPAIRSRGFNEAPARVLAENPVGFFAADGSAFLSTMHKAGPTVVDTTTRAARLALPAVKPAATGPGLTPSPDLKYAVVPFLDRQVVWDLTTGARVPGAAVGGLYGRPTPAAFSHRSGELAVHPDSTAVYEVATGKGTAGFASPPVAGFTPDDRLLLTRDGANLVLWRRTGLAERTFVHEAGAVRAFAFGPGGRLLAAAGGQYVSLWETDSGKLVGRWAVEGDDFLAFSPDEARLATGSPAAVEVWRLDPAGPHPVAAVVKRAAPPPPAKGGFGGPLGGPGFLEMGPGFGPFGQPGPGANPPPPNPRPMERAPQPFPFPPQPR
ncbi:caspase family protein [Urbifossiella limnaea]|uniref:caspase family protein n=1 Tax=Urbifossiella limnaea TaxID=2528023 RepID=UPI00119DB6C9|nr:caspase family protein [Urbifossiella limnaea]